MLKIRRVWMLVVIAVVLVTGCSGNGSANTDMETDQNQQNDSAIADNNDAAEVSEDEDANDVNDADEGMDDDDKVIVAENDAFRIFSPEPNSVVGQTFEVEGQAKVFEGTFQYSLEDGHNVLDEGTVEADDGAPEWGEFSLKVQYDKASSSHVTLFLYEQSAKDGSANNQLSISFEVDKAFIERFE